MSRKMSIVALAAFGLMGTCGAAKAAVIDQFDTQPDPQITVFGGSPVTATATYANVGGDNQMTLTESPNNKDSGFVWGLAGGQRIPVGADVDHVTIDSVGPASPGSKWDVVVEFANQASGGALVGNYDLYGDITTTGPVSFNISDILAAHSISASYYDLKIRTQPYSQANYAWTYTSISATAVPEPASIGLLGLAGLSLIARRRRMA